MRTPERAQTLIGCGAEKVIVGTSAFTRDGVNHSLLGAISAAVGPERVLVALDSKGGRVVVRGWTESLEVSETWDMPPGPSQVGAAKVQSACRCYAQTARPGWANLPQRNA